MNTTAMSVAKPFTTTSTQLPRSAQHYRRCHLRRLALVPINCKSSSDSATTSNGSGNASSPPPELPPIPPPDAVEIRFRRGSRRKSRQMEQQDGVGQSKKAEAKDWESMTMTEKAIELYMGEKGLLFWLNKLAYAAIFVIIGAWILFRFVGPALNLYQLDSAPLPPSSIFKGS